MSADPPGPGLILTVAPRAVPVELLLRIALDAEQIGASCLQLAADLEDSVETVAALRAQTGLLISATAGTSAAAVSDLVVGAATDHALITAGNRPVLTAITPDHTLADTAAVLDLARQLQAADLPASVSCHSPGALLTTLAAGAHVRVGTAGSTTAGPREDITLLARAAGIARLISRPALTVAQVRQLLALG